MARGVSALDFSAGSGRRARVDRVWKDKILRSAEQDGLLSSTGSPDGVDDIDDEYEFDEDDVDNGDDGE